MEKKKKPWENPGSIGGQFSSGVYELEAGFTVSICNRRLKSVTWL